MTRSAGEPPRKPQYCDAIRRSRRQGGGCPQPECDYRAWGENKYVWLVMQWDLSAVLKSQFADYVLEEADGAAWGAGDRQPRRRIKR